MPRTKHSTENSTIAPKPVSSNDATEEGWSDDAAPQHSDLLAGISAIEGVAGSPREKAVVFLDLISKHFDCLSGCLTVGVGGDEIELDHAEDIEGVEAWSANLRSTALEVRMKAFSVARLFGPGDTPRFAIVASPIDSGGRDPFGALAILVRCSSSNQAERIQLQLRAACLQMATVLTAKIVARGVVEMSDIARVYTRAGQFSTIQQFAYTITNSARERFNCDQAAMGLVRNDKVRVVCVSGLDNVKPRSPGVLKIEQAMGECADACCPMIAQSWDRWEETPLAGEGMLHQAWRASVNGASVLSIPIDAGDGPVAVVSFRRSGEEPFDEDDIESAKKLLVPLAGAIPLVARATRPLPAHTSQSALATICWCIAPKKFRRKIFILIAMFAIAWGALGTRMYRVSVPAFVIAKHEQIVSAPFDGRVASVLVRTGDRIELGQAMLMMDTAGLELERRDLEAELSNAQLRLTGGVVGKDPAAASITQGEIRSLESKLSLLLRELEDAVVRAPLAGIVIAPQLVELPGRMISTGDQLVMIAEDSSMSLELRVPQNRVPDMIEGNRIRFASYARPELPGFSELGRLAPSSVQRNGQSVFIAEADLPVHQSWLRPGMSGVAMIEVGDRPNWWLAAHGVIDAARLRFWFD